MRSIWRMAFPTTTAPIAPFRAHDYEDPGLTARIKRLEDLVAQLTKERVYLEQRNGDLYEECLRLRKELAELRDSPSNRR